MNSSGDKFYKKNRAKKEKIQGLKQNPSPLALEVSIDTANYMEKKLTPTDKRIFNAISSYINRFKVVYLSQKHTLAKVAGVTPETANRSVRKMERLGIITGLRCWNSSKYYVLNPIFHTFTLREQLKHIFKSFCFFSVVMLAAIEAEAKIQSEYINLKRREEYINYPTYNTCNTRGSFIGGDLEINPRKGRRMKPFKQEIDSWGPVPKYITDLKSPSLTKWGQIRLTAFPKDAISYASDNSGSLYKVKDPFALYFKLAKDYCDKQDIIPDWGWAKKLGEHLKMPLDAPCFFERKNEEPVGEPMKPASSVQRFNRNHSPMVLKRILSRDEMLAEREKFKGLIENPPADCGMLLDILIKTWKSEVTNLTKKLNDLDQIPITTNEARRNDVWC